MYVRRALSNASNTISKASVGRMCETLDEITKEGNVMCAGRPWFCGLEKIKPVYREGTWRIYAPLMTIRFRD